MKRTVIQWALFITLMLTGVGAFIVLLGESDITLANTILIKAVALAVLAGVCSVGRSLSEKGWLPDVEEI